MKSTLTNVEMECAEYKEIIEGYKETLRVIRLIYKNPMIEEICRLALAERFEEIKDMVKKEGPKN